MKPGFLLTTVCGLVTVVALSAIAGLLASRRSAPAGSRDERTSSQDVATGHGWRGVPTTWAARPPLTPSHRLISTVWRPRGPLTIPGIERLPPVIPADDDANDCGQDAVSVLVSSVRSAATAELPPYSVMVRRESPEGLAAAAAAGSPSPIRAISDTAGAGLRRDPLPVPRTEAALAETVATTNAADGAAGHRSPPAPAEGPVTFLSPEVQVALAPVLEMAHRGYQQASVLAERGAVYLARQRLEGVLYELADALDRLSDQPDHRENLALGLQALKEAADFLPPAGTAPSEVRVMDRVARHRTRILKSTDGSPVTPAEAVERYSKYAQVKLSRAGRHLPVAADALFALGKLSLAQAETSGGTKRAQLLAATTCFRAALDVNDRHYLAANELGVLLAREGRLTDARDYLQASVAVRPTADTWHNLAIVHQRLGDQERAQRSLAEWRLALERLDRRQPQLVTAKNGSSVYWVDKATFEAASGGVQR